MSRPSEKPNWATDNIVDPENGSANKIVPTTDKQQYGQRTEQNTIRQDINYLFNKIREWIQFFDEQTAVNDVYIVADNSQSEATISAQLGGTWSYGGGSYANAQDTLGGENILVFKKTSEDEL